MREIYHALVLNMHQPPRNLENLLETNEWEVKEILFAYDRMPRALWAYQDIARVHLSLSGTLLGFTLIVLGKKELQSKIPYGPHIALGAGLWMLCGPACIALYLSWAAGNLGIHPLLLENAP